MSMGVAVIIVAVTTIVVIVACALVTWFLSVPPGGDQAKESNPQEK